MYDDLDYDTMRLRREGHAELIDDLNEQRNQAIEHYNDVVESRANHEGIYSARDEKEALAEIHRLDKELDEEDFDLP